MPGLTACVHTSQAEPSPAERVVALFSSAHFLLFSCWKVTRWVATGAEPKSLQSAAELVLGSPSPVSCHGSKDDAVLAEEVNFLLHEELANRCVPQFPHLKIRSLYL